MSRTQMHGRTGVKLNALPPFFEWRGMGEGEGGIKKRSSLKGMYLLPCGVNSPFSVDPF